MKKEKKVVTLPIGNLNIFNALAEISWSNKENKEQSKKESYKDKIIQELGKEAFLHSFTPSGEIGSGESYGNNPHSDNTKLFTAIFDEIFSDEGLLLEVFSGNTNSEKVAKKRMLQFKSLVMSLIKMYIECCTDFDCEDKTEISKEIDDYVKMLVSAIFFHNISNIFLLDISEVENMIYSNKLITIQDKNIKEAILKLKSKSHKKIFLQRVKQILKENT